MVQFIRRVKVLHRVLSSVFRFVDPSFRALSGRLKFTVRRHQCNEDSLSSVQCPMFLQFAQALAYPPDPFKLSPQIVTSKVSTGASKRLYQARP